MATTIFFNGLVIGVPGSYSRVDASGLEAVGLGATGIVAMIGEAVGGRPVSSIDDPADLLRFSGGGGPQQNRDTWRSGDLREAGGILFDPADDAQILAGAQQIVACKVNPATQGAATLGNAQGDAVDVTSEDWGAFVNQINVSIADGTNQGKLISIIFEEITEAFDDIGGDNVFTLDYETDAITWDAMTAAINAAGAITCAATRAELGFDGDITALLAQGAVRVVSADVGDTTQTVTIYGLDATGNPVSETLSLDGTTPVDGSQVFGLGDVFGAIVSGTTVGAVVVSDQVIPTTIMTIPLGIDQSQGLIVGRAMFVANTTIAAILDAAGTPDLIIEGKNAAGVTVLEKITLTGAVSAPGSTVLSEVTKLILGDVAVARTMTLSGTAAQSDATVQTTIQQAADFFNAKSIVVSGPTTLGFVFAIVTSSLDFLTANLDVTISPASIVGPPVGFLADLFAFIDTININSALITATEATGAVGGAPDNTTAPVFLAGGVEGTTTFADYQKALNLLKRLRINTIVTTTGDPAVHAAIEAHNAFMGGVGRSERDGKVGALNAGLTDVPTKIEFKQQSVDLNSRHMQLVGQAVERFNTSGVRQEFLPPFTACVAAGMQAGSPVGTPLTNKFASILGFRQDTTWNPKDDAEEMIQAGLLFLENIDGVGRRWVRGVTTHLTSNNLAFTEASVNQAANFAAFNFRTAMEFFVGQQGFAGTKNAAKGVAITQLGLQVDANVLVGYQSLAFDIVLDVLEISVQIAVVIPINFVTTVLHLVTAQQLAA